MQYELVQTLEIIHNLHQAAFMTRMLHTIHSCIKTEGQTQKQECQEEGVRFNHAFKSQIPLLIHIL